MKFLTSNQSFSYFQKLFYFIFCVFLSSSTNLFGDIKFRHLGFEDGLTQITIRSLYQDELGAIWLATNEDVKRYNGNNFEEIDIHLSKKNSYKNTIQTICGNHKGKLYFKTDLNTVIEYDMVKESSKMIFENPEVKSTSVISFGSNCLWIAQHNKIFNYNNNSINFKKSLQNTSSQISAIVETRNHNLIVGTKKNGLFILYPSGIERQLISKSSSEITSIFEDSRGRIWVGTWNDGIFLIEQNKLTMEFNVDGPINLKLSSNYVRTICEDDDANIWFGTAKGLNKYDLTKSIITHYGTDKKNSLQHPSVWSLIKDNQGTIWVATFYGGINYFNPTKEVFSFTDLTEYESPNKYPIISKIIEDKRNNLWIGTESKGLIFHNTKTDEYKNFNEENHTLSKNTIKSIYYDPSNDILWLGTHLGGLNRYDIKKNKFSFINISDEHESNLTQSVLVIVPYNNYLYLGTLSGIYRYNMITGVVDQEKQMVGRFSIVKDLVIDKQQNMWIASNGLYRYNLVTKKIEDFHTSINYSNAPIQTLVNDIHIDNKNRLWLGTTGAGVILFEPKTKKIKEFTTQTSGIESNYISSIAATNSGVILAATSKGVSFIEEKSSKCFNYNTKNGFPLLSMLNGYILPLNNGNIALGGINGICYFNEELLFVPEKSYKIRFDKLWVNNKLVKPNDETEILKNALPFNQKITLQHYQKIVAIEIASNNFIRKNQPNFQYKIKNYTNDWINFNIEKPINLMNLSPGSYTLQVRKSILNEVDSNNQIEMEIEILPPFYATWYAYVLYGLIILSVVIWIMSFYRSRLMLQTSLVFERKDKEQKELANQSKLRFFTNISHEFRTPITLIIGQLELLMQSTKIASSHYKDIVNIHRNALKMTRLINELLDFRKQEQGFMKLKVSERDLVEFLREIFVSFTDYAISKKIKLDFIFDNESKLIWYDYIQLQKVFYNLLSNAFKYTSKDGEILIELKNYENYVTVTISDTGVGIPNDTLHRVFDQFYQDERECIQNLQNPGTGLGLALSKGIMELHGGKIDVKSEIGNGSAFMVTLFCGNQHFGNNENIEFVKSNVDPNEYDVQFSTSDLEFIDEAAETQKENFQNIPTLLIVEDNDELRNVLIRIFKPMYKILDTNNGLSGFNIAKEKQPDLILSDIMMPKMNGNEMCSKIKNDFETCHIPVVLLTAQTTVEQNIDGLKSGADDFISKPFNVKILVMRCNNLLTGRKMLQEKYTKNVDISPKPFAYSALDQNFIDKAVSIIEQNARDKHIDVDFLCSEMAIGRRVFFNKMKSISGQTPNDFILTVKFKLAATMLKNNLELNISEISDALGFSSSKYFGKCFKEQFGISPSQMRDELTE